VKPIFEHAVNAAITVNSVTVIWELFGHSELAEQAELACLGIFVAELFIRLHRVGWDGIAFWRSPWNAADVLIIGLTLLPVLGADTSLLRLARLFRTVHWVRHAAHVRWIRYLRRRPVAEGV
jgi:Ion transport protein